MRDGVIRSGDLASNPFGRYSETGGGGNSVAPGYRNRWLRMRLHRRLPTCRLLFPREGRHYAASPPGPFWAMSLEAINWAWSQVIGNPTRKLVLMALADHVDERGECWPSLRRIADRAECEPRTVRRHLRDLEESGFIEIVSQHRPDGSQTSNRYRVAMSGGADNLSGGGDTSVRGGRTPVSPHEPSLEPSKENSIRPKAVKKRVTPDYPEDFEEVWNVHPRGPKKDALPEYLSAVPDRITHSELLTNLRHYVESEVRDDFKGVHLHRWIRDDRWEEQLAQARNGTHRGPSSNDWLAGL